MGVTTETHEEVKAPAITDAILPKHEDERLRIAEILTTAGKEMYAAKTYKDVYNAMHKGAVDSDASEISGLLEVADPDHTFMDIVEENKHSGPTNEEGAE